MHRALSELLVAALRHGSVLDARAFLELETGLAGHFRLESAAFVRQVEGSPPCLLASSETHRAWWLHALGAIEPGALGEAGSERRLVSVAIAPTSQAIPGRYVGLVPCATDAEREPIPSRELGGSTWLAIACEHEADVEALPVELLCALGRALLPSIERGLRRGLEERVASLLDASSAAVLVWDERGRIRDLNASAEQLVGASRDALVGTDVRALFDEPPEPDSVEERRELRRLDGRTLVVAVTARISPSERGVESLALLRDVSEVVASERDASERLELLRDLTEQHMLLLDNAPLLIFRIEPASGELLYVNRYVEQMFRVNSAQVLSSPGFLRSLHLDPEGSAAFDLAVASAREGKAPDSYEARLGVSDGEPIIARATIYPILSEVERVVGVEGIVLDVTRERAVRSRLLEADRLATIGMLAAGVAHEINNPAAFILLGLDLLSRNLFGPEVSMSQKADPVVRQLVQDLKESGRRIVAIARDMRTFAGPPPPSGQRATVDVNRAVESALTLARGPISEFADLELDLAEDLPMVALDEGRVAQVVVNLLVNAAQAVAEARASRGAHRQGDRVRVSTRSVGRRVEIIVEDSGPGISPELTERVFLPFFTTRESNGGTGLGLAIIKAIVDAAGGDIRVESPGAPVGSPPGARFVVALPVELSEVGVDPEPALTR